MRAPRSMVVHPMILGLWAVGLAAAAGCSDRPDLEAVAALDRAGNANDNLARREENEEQRCCDRHFFFNGRLRAACLFEAARHRGACAPPRRPTPDAGRSPDAAPVDAGSKSDASPADASVKSDASPADASAKSDAFPADASAKSDAFPADASGSPACPTAIPFGGAPQVFSNHAAWALSADVNATETVTWSTSTSQLLATSGPAVELECTGVGTAIVTATIAGPGSCVLAETIALPCSAFCGNGILEPGEQCDPPDGLTCNSQCQIGPPLACGDGIIETGETCDSPNVLFCRNCQITSCYGCITEALFANPSIKGDVCLTLQGTQETKCQTLEACMFQNQNPCDSSTGPIIGCFCSDASCSAGVNGRCGSQLEAFAGTTDPAEIVAASASSIVNQLSFGLRTSEACNSVCATMPPPT